MPTFLDKVRQIKKSTITATLEARVKMLNKHVARIVEQRPRGFGLDKYRCEAAAQEYEGLLKIAKKS